MRHRFLRVLTSCLAVLLVFFTPIAPAFASTNSLSTLVLAQRPIPNLDQDTRTDHQKGIDTGCNIGRTEGFWAENIQVYKNTLELASKNNLADYKVGVIEGYESCRAPRESARDIETNCSKPPTKDGWPIVDCDAIPPGELQSPAE